MEKLVMEAVRAQFRPEFLNRLDDIIIFHQLKLPEIMKIVDIQVSQLSKRLKDRKIHIVLSEEAKDFVARTGFDPTFGARPLKRTIQHKILDPLAMKILNKEFCEGDSIEVDVDNAEIVFKKQENKVN